MFRREFLVAFQVEIALHVLAYRYHIADLRSNAENPRFKAADTIAGAAVAGQLVVPVTDEPQLKLLGDELEAPRSRCMSTPFW